MRVSTNSTASLFLALRACITTLTVDSMWPALTMSPANSLLLPPEVPVIQTDPWTTAGHVTIATIPHATRSHVAIGWANTDSERQLLFALMAKRWKYGRLILILSNAISHAPIAREIKKLRIKCCMIIWLDGERNMMSCPSLCSHKTKDPLTGRDMVVDIGALPPYLNVRADWEKIGLQAVTGVFGNMYSVIEKAGNITEIHLYQRKTQKMECDKLRNIVDAKQSMNQQFFTDLLTNKFDITINQLVMSTALPLQMDVSGAFYMSCSSWFVPSAQLVSPLVHVVLPLQLSGWGLVLAAFLLGCCALKLLGRLESSEAALYALSIILGTSSSSPPHMPRLALGSLRLGCLVLAFAYQSKLASILTVPFYEAQLDTAADIVSANLRVTMPCATNSFFAQPIEDLSPEDPNRYIIPRIEIQNDFDAGISLVAAREAVFLGATLPVLFAIRREHRGLVYRQPGCAYLSPVGFVLRRGDPRVGRLNELVARVVQAGLVSKWESDAIRDLKLQGGAIVGHAVVSLGMKHLAGAYLALGLGLMGAVVVFGVELVIGVTKRKKREKMRRLWQHAREEFHHTKPLDYDGIMEE